MRTKIDGYRDLFFVGHNDLMGYCNRCIGFLWNEKEQKYEWNAAVPKYFDGIDTERKRILYVGGLSAFDEFQQRVRIGIFSGIKVHAEYIEQVIPETAIAIENRYIGKKEKSNPDVRPEMNRNIPLEEIAEKIEYLYTYEKMLCEVSASSQYEELEPLPEGTVISAAVPYYPLSEQEYESGKYYFTGGEWLPVANQEERIQKIKEMERVAILFTVIEREDYELAIPSWKSLFTEHGKAKGQLSHILQTGFPTTP